MSIRTSLLVSLPTLGLLAALQDPAEPVETPPGPAVQHSDSCARCHSNAPDASAMRDADGRGIAPYDLWSGTMMANAARDPLWRAVVSAEVAATPSRRAEIEETCLSCHAPMAQRLGLEDHDTGSAMHLLECESELGEIARDGVSCTVCHGMSPEGLGTPESYSAGFELDDWRRMFGPHAEPFAMPMRMHTGFTPTRGDHVLSSAMCGSCHTLETEALNADGSLAGAKLLEQAPFLEWRNSIYAEEGGKTCQECHVPTTETSGAPIHTRIVRNPMGTDFPPTRARSPFGRHTFVGGNTLVLGLLRDHAADLGVQASREALQSTIDATHLQLTQHTATVSVEDVQRAGAGSLRFDVRVANLTGHKLPTAHPTRRAWLRILVRDELGRVQFSSGTTDAAGRILNAAGQPLASELAGGPIEPHRDVVRTSDEVATYEAVMADANGEPTHILMRGASWHVDDRLLPRGWRADGPDADRTTPIGTDDDADFIAGEDRVRFDVPLRTDGPISIEAALLYQPLSARWAAELMEWDTPEIATFRAMYEAADLTPVVLASDTND